MASSKVFWAGLGVVGAMMVSCTSLLDLDGYHLHDAGSGVGGASSSSATGSSGTGSSASSASNASSSSGAGGGAPCTVMHPGGGSCEYMPGMECGCPPNQKCTIDDLKTGHTKCIAHGAVMPWETCNDDSDCDKGSWCDLWTLKVCRPICSNANQCPSGGKCIQTSSDPDPMNFTAIPGLKVCSAHCDPESAAPCGTGVTCVYNDHDQDLQCMTTANYIHDTTCFTVADCAKGLVCVTGVPGSPLPICVQWCHPADGLSHAACPVNEKKCAPLPIMVNYNGSTYGYCSP